MNFHIVAVLCKQFLLRIFALFSNMHIRINFHCNFLYLDITFKYQQNKNSKEAREETEGKSSGCTGEGKRLIGNIRVGSREGKTGTVLQLSLEVR